MKQILRHVVAFCLLLGVFTACEPLSNTFDEYIVPGGITYTGKASSPLVHVGRNRVQISWLRGTDPSVTKARIFWNNYADSVEVAIPATGNTIKVIIDNLTEQTYSFIIKTYDDKGNTSVPVELLAAAFGEKYQARILSRPVNAALLDGAGVVTLKWGGANISGGAYATEVTYTDNTDNTQVLRVPITEESTTIADMKPGTTILYNTIYLPELLTIDTFYTSMQEHNQFLFDKKDWRVIAYSTQHNTAAANVVTNFIDGKPSSRWHTLVNGSSRYPHFVTVDMKTERTVTDFEVFRQTGDNRGCSTFQLLVSTDNSTWVDAGTFNFDYLNDVGQFYAMPPNTKARYFKFVGLSGPERYMVMGEINAYGF